MNQQRSARTGSKNKKRIAITTVTIPLVGDRLLSLLAVDTTAPGIDKITFRNNMKVYTRNGRSGWKEKDGKVISQQQKGEEFNSPNSKAISTLIFTRSPGGISSPMLI